VLITTLLGYYRKDDSPRGLEAMAKVIHGAVENVAHSVKFLESPFEEEKLIDELTEMISLYVESI